MAKTVAQIIDARGGSAAFARQAGLTADAVRMMKHRQKFPRTVWPEILKAFEDVTLDDLLAVEDKEPQRAA